MSAPILTGGVRDRHILRIYFFFGGGKRCLFFCIVIWPLFFHRYSDPLVASGARLFRTFTAAVDKGHLIQYRYSLSLSDTAVGPCVFVWCAISQALGVVIPLMLLEVAMFRDLRIFGPKRSCAHRESLRARQSTPKLTKQQQSDTTVIISRTNTVSPRNR